MPGVDAPQARGSVEHPAPIIGDVVHTVCGNEQARRPLELPVRREGHPERIEIVGCRLSTRERNVHCSPFCGLTPQLPTPAYDGKGSGVEVAGLSCLEALMGAAPYSQMGGLNRS